MRFLCSSLALLLTASACFGQAFTLHRPYVGRAAVDPDLVLLIDLAYYWPFNATRETNYVTGTLPEFPGSPSTLVGLTNGIWGTAAYFDNTARNISIPINFWTNTWTCSFWFRPEAMGANGVVMGTYTSPDVWFLQVKDATTLKLAMYDNLAGYNEIDQTVALNTWYFFCFGYNSTNNTVWMQNNDNPRTTLTMAHAIRETTTAVTVSGGIPGTPGRFDECAIWSRELTTNEVTMLETDGICQYLGTNCTAVPFVITQPVSVAGDTNSVQWFHTVSLGGRQNTYRWQSNGVSLAESLLWSGTGTPDLWVTNNGTMFNDLSLTLLATNAAGAVTSSPALFTITNAFTNGLVAYWKFDENTGVQVSDSSGSGVSGFFSNSPTWGIGPTWFGSCLSNNAAGYADFGTNNLSTLTNVTLTAWVNAKSYGAFNTVFSKKVGADVWQHVIKSNGKQDIWVKPSGAGGYINIDGTGPLTVVTGAWQHVAFTYDNTALKSFLNGGLDAQVLTNNPGLMTNFGRFNVANDPANAGRPWVGRIDDVRIYDHAQSTNMMGWLYLWRPTK